MLKMDQFVNVLLAKTHSTIEGPGLWTRIMTESDRSRAHTEGQLLLAT